MGRLSHGTQTLPGRVLVFRKEQWFCTKCGSALVDVQGDHERISCTSAGCDREGWILLRPDLSSCEVVGLSEMRTVPEESSLSLTFGSVPPSGSPTVDQLLARRRAGSAGPGL